MHHNITVHNPLHVCVCNCVAVLSVPPWSLKRPVSQYSGPVSTRSARSAATLPKRVTYILRVFCWEVDFVTSTFSCCFTVGVGTVGSGARGDWSFFGPSGH